MEYELFRKQTESIMTLLTETARNEIEKLFECEKSSFLIDIHHDGDLRPALQERQLKIVRFF